MKRLLTAPLHPPLAQAVEVAVWIQPFAPDRIGRTSRATRPIVPALLAAVTTAEMIESVGGSARSRIKRAMTMTNGHSSVRAVPVPSSTCQVATMKITLPTLCYALRRVS
jgi:hypothetical protein